MNADDVKKLWQILDTIEEKGGEVHDFNASREHGDGIAGQMNAVMGGSGTTHFYVDITIPNDYDHDEGEPVEIDGADDIGDPAGEDVRGDEVTN